MQFNIARDERSDKLCIRCRAGAAASDGLANIMNLCFGSPVSYALGRSHSLACCTFSQFLSATIGPAVARVSAPSTIPSLKRQPTIVVPVLVAFGVFTPLLSRKALLSELSQSKFVKKYI